MTIQRATSAALMAALTPSAPAPEKRASLENPAIPLSSDGIVALLGTGLSTDAGVNVSEQTAMMLATVWRCVTLIADTVAQLPLRVYRDGDTSRAELDVALLQNPFPGLTPFAFWEMVMVHLLLWGNAYILKVKRELDEQVVQLYPIPPWNVTPQRPLNRPDVQPLPKVYRINSDLGGPTVELTDDDVLHIPGLGYDGIRGLGPVAYFRQGLGLALATEQFGARFFGSGSLMSGVLQTDRPLTQDQAEQVKTRWQQKMSGLQRAHEAVVLDLGLKWTPISIPPEDAQFLQTRQFAVNEICRWFGVPPHLAGDVDKTTSWGAGIAEQSLGFHRYTLSHWTTRLEQYVTAGGILLPGEVAEFDLDRLLRGDTAARYNAYSVGISAGFLCPADARRAERMPIPPDAEAELEKFKAAAAPPPPVAVHLGSVNGSDTPSGTSGGTAE